MGECIEASQDSQVIAPFSCTTPPLPTSTPHTPQIGMAFPHARVNRKGRGILTPRPPGWDITPKVTNTTQVFHAPLSRSAATQRRLITLDRLAAGDVFPGKPNSYDAGPIPAFFASLLHALPSIWSRLPCPNCKPGAPPMPSSAHFKPLQLETFQCHLRGASNKALFKAK